MFDPKMRIYGLWSVVSWIPPSYPPHTNETKQKTNISTD